MVDENETNSEKEAVMINTGDTEEKVDPIIRDGVTAVVLAAYSVGHFANDLCASMWFIYLSYYLLNVV